MSKGTTSVTIGESQTPAAVSSAMTCSAVFYHSPEQRETAERVIKELTAARVWDSPVVTEVVPLETFYPAEDYHQDYFERNPFQPYCRAVVAPKVSKFRKHFLEKLKA